MLPLARQVPVIYLDGGTDGKGKITSFQPEAGITVIRGLIPLMQAMERRGLNGLIPLLANQVLRRWLRPYRRVLFWNTENLARPYRFIKHDALIFDCIDPCFVADADIQRDYDRREQEVLAAARKVFATSDSLVEHCRRYHSDVTLLNNACAPEDYAPCLLAQTPRPGWWPDTSKPIAAYLGSLDWRFDFDCALRAARDNSNTQFIFAGNIVQDFAARIAELRALPNVVCPGKVSLEDGRYLLSHCAIGLIPFTRGEMNDAINPVKMYAYAQLGKPIVGTAIRELASRPEIAVTVATPQTFSEAISRTLVCADNPASKSALQAFAARNTWQERANQAWAILETM